MITEQLEEQAALYASGALAATQRAQFELILDHHDELRAFTHGLEAVAAAVLLGEPHCGKQPCPSIKARLLAQIGRCAQRCRKEGFVMTGPDALVMWVNPAFSTMCGYRLEELQGRKLGPILQGELTDKGVACRMREAIHQQVPCAGSLVNYHKNGTPYWVSINITPIRDADGKLLWFVARENELTERPLAA